MADESLSGALQHAVEEGRDRLRRNWLGLAATGTVGGIDLGLGVLAMLIVRDATGSRLLGALAFGIGFIALILARSELFTENFLVPIVAVVAHGHGSWRDVGRLWTGTLVFNLVGGWIVMGLIVHGVPGLARSGVIGEVGGHFIKAGVDSSTFAAAVLAGASMTLLTWMERATHNVAGKLVAAVSIAFVLAGAPLLHSIVSSLEMFGALHVGADFGYLDWAGMFVWSALGNVVGGVGLVTVLRVVQARSEASTTGQQDPVTADKDGDDGVGEDADGAPAGDNRSDDEDADAALGASR